MSKEMEQDSINPEAPETPETPTTDDTAASSMEMVGPDAPSVKTARFAALGDEPTSGEQSPMDLLLDVQLDLSVELGRTKVPVRDILHLGSGSIIELDAMCGEPVDVLANGKLIAKGEVVVVDDNFGVRITEIVKRPKDSSLQAA